MLYQKSTLILIISLCSLNLLGGTELAKAIKEGKTEKVEEIIKNDPKLVNREIPAYGYPLFIAVSSGKVDIVKLLLDNGADVKIKHPKSKENVVFRLLDPRATEASLERAIEIIALLKEKKTDFNVINYEKMTALYDFCTESISLKSLDTKLKFLGELIKAGAKTDIKLKRDEPLLNAVLMKVLKSNPDHIEVAKLLIKMGCPVNEKSKKDAECADSTSVTEDDTPLIIVTKRDGFQGKDRTEMIVLLIENGAKTTAKNKKRETPKKLLDRRDSFYKEHMNALRKTKAKKRK